MYMIPYVVAGQCKYMIPYVVVVQLRTGMSP
jgi:hypothetical protein